MYVFALSFNWFTEFVASYLLLLKNFKGKLSTEKYKKKRWRVSLSCKLAYATFDHWSEDLLNYICDFFVLLTENYRLQETYENHLIIKLVSVRLVLPLVSHQTNEYYCNSMN